MKQYLLLLKSTDFNKSNNIWTSNAINLYSNSQYKNYSYTRSGTGLNLIGDRTFVGTEITSPSYGSEVEAISENAIYKTNYGEVVYESATPSVLRFVDTTSRIDILSYRHIFTNISGTSYPSFNLQIYESDAESGPWLKSVFTSDSNTIFLRGSKQFIKIELEIIANELDTNTLGLIFYLEIGIHDPVSNVISTGAKNILRRFPSWTALYEDSMDDATPEIATPESVGGAMVNAIVQESLTDFQNKIDYNLINSFINTADLNQLAWCYMASNVPANINTIFGDGIELARVSSINDFFSSRLTDYVFYYNPIDRQLLTIRNYNTLLINNSPVVLEPINIFNDFDEFGARVALPRLYLESNDNYRKRILDVAVNPPSSSLEGFKRTLRRELDLWRAYGSTPDSSYSGATPIVLEISDIETSTPYVDQYGNPTKLFRTFVDTLNEKYPSNFGYVNWNEAVWDSGGLEGEGLGRLSANYDYSSTPDSEDFQNGVGDVDDIKLEIVMSESSTMNFTGSSHIRGRKKTGSIPNYAPIIIDYETYSTYLRQVSDYENTKAQTGLVYEIDLPPHNNYATPSTFYANINYNNFEDLVVGNRFLASHPASPEFNLFKVFDQEGFSVIQFKDKEYDSVYLNTDSTPYSEKINVHDAEEIRVVFSQTWDQENQEYDSLTVDGYRFTFNTSTPEWVSYPSEGATVSLSSPNIDWMNASIKVGSNIYASKEELFNTKISYLTDSKNQSSRIVLNALNSIGSETSATVNTSELINLSLLPVDATPQNIFINVKTPGLYPVYGSNEVSQSIGGVVYDPETNQNWLIPSSPNIVWQSFDSNNSPIGSQSFFESATINYSSTPSYIKIESYNYGAYPLVQSVYEGFTLSSTPMFEGYIDQNNNTYRPDENYQNSFFNQDQMLGAYSLNKETFGLSDEDDFEINTIYFSATPNSIIISTTDSVQGIVNTINNDSSFDVTISAKKYNFSEGIYSVGLHPGWFYLNDQEYYNYINSVTESATGQYFELELNDTPRAGAPIIVDVNGSQFRNVVFEDAATPGKFSFYNKEIVKSTYNGILPLAYANVTRASVVDTFTGLTVATNESTESSLLEPFDYNDPTSYVAGRDYEVTYYVEDAYFVDKDIYNDNTGTYSSKLYLSSTPDTLATPNYIYNVTYESSDLSLPKIIDLDINQISNPLDEGFVYLSKEEYPFARIETKLSPGYISDDDKDFMFLSVISYDENNNLKPGQTFQVAGPEISATPEYITTNDNGLGVSIIRYSGPVPAENDQSSIEIIGIAAATPNGGLNSQTAGYYKELDFNISRKIKNRLQIKATPVRYNIDADQLTNNTIVGSINWDGYPLMSQVNLRWAKARTLYDLFNEVNTYEFGSTLQSDSDGRFSIVDEIVSESNIEPGYWFAKVEIVDSNQIINILTELGEVIDQDEITISGDIVYWYEEYDNVHFTNEFTPLPNVFTFERQMNSDLIATPNFVYSHHNQVEIININSTPNWIPPRWVPLRRFDQYQMGIFGSTPGYIDDYSLMHPDKSEE